MVRVSFWLMMMLGLPALLGCQQRPLTPAEIQDQHRFQVGCLPRDVQGYEMNKPYCSGHEGGNKKI